MIVEALVEPARRRRRAARAQRAAHAAVQLGERDDGAGIRERVAQAIVVEWWSAEVGVTCEFRAARARAWECYHRRERC